MGNQVTRHLTLLEAVQAEALGNGSDGIRLDVRHVGEPFVAGGDDGSADVGRSGVGSNDMDTPSPSNRLDSSIIATAVSDTLHINKVEALRIHHQRAIVVSPSLTSLLPGVHRALADAVELDVEIVCTWCLSASGRGSLTPRESQILAEASSL